jgi:hypothetical protein
MIFVEKTKTKLYQYYQLTVLRNNVIFFTFYEYERCSYKVLILIDDCYILLDDC